MKKNFMLILFTITAVASLGQSKSDDYNLSLDFGPSFMSASKLIVRSKGDSSFLNIQIYKNYRTEEKLSESKVFIPFSKLSPLTNFLKTYKFQIKTSIDTVGSHKEFIHGDSILTYIINVGMDGINVNGIIDQNNIRHKFAFWSPNKGTENAKLVSLLFDLVNDAFRDQKTINYIEQLQQYFPHQLGLKTLSTNPLTYKLFGSISSDEQEELDVFLKNLPLHQKIIIDMSNYSGMGTMFYDVFEEYCVNNRNIYWLNPSFQGLVDLYKIGIPNSNILSKKKISKIIEKNGRQLISYKD